MKNIIALALISSVATSLIVSASAEARPFWKTRVNHRQTRQENRIYGGVNSGALTKREYRHVEAKEANLAREEARFRRTGNGLSPREANRLNRQQNQLSRNIYNQKHDGQVR
jgi:hypothetical protein